MKEDFTSRSIRCSVKNNVRIVKHLNITRNFVSYDSLLFAKCPYRLREVASFEWGEALSTRSYLIAVTCRKRIRFFTIFKMKCEFRVIFSNTNALIDEKSHQFEFFEKRKKQLGNDDGSNKLHEKYAPTYICTSSPREFYYSCSLTAVSILRKWWHRLCNLMQYTQYVCNIRQ